MDSAPGEKPGPRAAEAELGFEAEGAPAGLRDEVRALRADVARFQRGVERRVAEALGLAGPLARTVAELQSEHERLRAHLGQLARHVEALAHATGLPLDAGAEPRAGPASPGARGPPRFASHAVFSLSGRGQSGEQEEWADSEAKRVSNASVMENGHQVTAGPGHLSPEVPEPLEPHPPSVALCMPHQPVTAITRGSEKASGEIVSPALAGASVASQGPSLAPSETGKTAGQPGRRGWAGACRACHRAVAAGHTGRWGLGGKGRMPASSPRADCQRGGDGDTRAHLARSVPCASSRGCPRTVTFMNVTHIFVIISKGREGFRGGPQSCERWSEPEGLGVSVSLLLSGPLYSVFSQVPTRTPKSELCLSLNLGLSSGLAHSGPAGKADQGCPITDRPLCVHPCALGFSQHIVGPQGRLIMAVCSRNLAQCERLIEVDDMMVMGRKPDPMCVFTYVQSLYNHLRRFE
ncbi:smoothelin-like protein 2 [Sminthopsis crassicaudata]|uniref:smoothelin-like protein 2 n=1 Tax=Sminthopsis crassicaudata TaxID=9301 RepID=UPI003D69DB22